MAVADAPVTEDLFKQAVAAFEGGQLVEAERLCAAVFKDDPDHFGASRLTAAVQYRSGRRAEALASFDRILAIRSDLAEVHNNRGVVLQDLLRLDEALASYDRAIAIEPNYAEAYNNRAVALHYAGRGDEALASCDAALALRPNYGDAHFNRGIVLADLGRHAEALASFDQTLGLKADTVVVNARRAATLRALCRFEEALAACDRALTIRPQYAEAHVVRGRILVDMRRFPEALAAFASAQALAPEHPEAYCAEAAARLLTGDFVRGLPKFEWRLKRAPPAPPPRQYTQPQWDGLVSLYDKTILLYGEARLADTIRFLRYVPLVAARGARIILDVTPPLRSLAAGLAGVTQVVGQGDALPDFDLQCPLMSLPLAFGTKLESIPAPTPYLRPSTDSLLSWEARLGALRRPRIGLAWTSDAPPRETGQSIELHQLQPLFEIEASFVRLQKDLRPGDDLVLRHRNVFDPTEMLKDFVDLAALIARLDGIVSVDNSVAQIAGALARPLFLLLPFTPDWPWLLERGTTPWYPSARLYRQTTPGDWTEPVRRLVADVPGLLNRSTSVAGGAARKPT